MISMIFVVLYDILHYCNLPYEHSETESSRFENNVTSSHTSECRLAVRSATRIVREPGGPTVHPPGPPPPPPRNLPLWFQNVP